jgi:hypothetical protein
MKLRPTFLSYQILIWLFLGFFSVGSLHAEKSPNVILVLTDDQDIGDLGCHGNPWIKTPHIDSFYEDVVRLTDFHVSPVCPPTRSAIMTGRYPINNGAGATYKGREALSGRFPTMAEFSHKTATAPACSANGTWAKTTRSGLPIRASASPSNTSPAAAVNCPTIGATTPSTMFTS